MEYSKELIELCELRKTKRISNYIKKDSYMFLLLKTETSFLNYAASTSDRLYYIENDIHDQVRCAGCGSYSRLKYQKGEYTILYCSTKCKLSEIDSMTGLTGYELKSKKTQQTLSIVNKFTGLTISQERDIKVKEINSSVDPTTGLTGYEQIAMNRHQTLSKIDPTTGLTGYKAVGLTIKTTNSIVDPETGLNIYQKNGIKISKTISKVNPNTGLTIAQERIHKIKATNSIVDPESGLTGYERTNIKISKTNSNVNKFTGLTIAQERGIRVKLSNSKVDPESGLTGYETSTMNRHNIMSRVDSETGLTGYETSTLKTSKTRRAIWFTNVLLSKFPDDQVLLTTLDDYICSNKLLKYQCKSCDSIEESYWPYIRCNTCYPYNKSIAENEVFEYCKSLVDNVECNTRKVIKPLELDVYIPEVKLAIEYNGLYWHSSNSVETENKEYHLNKTELCKEKGIQLLHIFENEWINPIKQNIWKSIIRNKLGKSERIYGRKCTIQYVNNKDKTDFLEVNHLQGTCTSSINIGLYYENELVSLMTFGKSRYDKKIDWELLRFCNRLGSSVLGAASKLLKNFMSNYTGSIISYADRRRSDGGLYEKLGFNLVRESKPNYFYYKNNGLESRINYQKHKLQDKLEVFDSNLTESENMYNNEYRKIYDCGNLVYIY